MSQILLCSWRRSLNISHISSIRSTLLRPLNLSATLCTADFSTIKSKAGSSKAAGLPFEHPFNQPADEKTRRLKLQEQIRFRESFKLEQDYELIYSLPKLRLYNFMHFFCTCATIATFAFVIIHFHREMLDMEPIMNQVNRDIPPWCFYSIATVLGVAFTAVLVMISKMPVRLYYSPVRRSYVLFYHPTIGVLSKKKLVFGEDQYKIMPQKLDNIDAPQRSVKFQTNFAKGVFKMNKSFYLIEDLFRSKRDLCKFRLLDMKDRQSTTEKTKESDDLRQENDIWETVMENKSGQKNKVDPPSRTFMSR